MLWKAEHALGDGDLFIYLFILVWETLHSAKQGGKNKKKSLDYFSVILLLL